MVATGQEAANRASALGADERAGRAVFAANCPLTEFRVAIGLYALWAAIAWLSIAADRVALPPQAAGVLIIGVAATNVLFLLIARSGPEHRPPDVTITLSQSVLGVTWTTLFTFMSAGADVLAVAMYISAMLFAVPRISIAAASQLAAFATASFGIVVLFKALLTGSQPPLWSEFVSVMAFAGVIVSVLFYRRHLDVASRSRAGGSASTEQAGDTQHSRYHSLLDILAREKGRTDRSNNPFCLCVFDTNGFDRMLRDADRETTERVRERITKRIRGELRAMDGVKPVSTARAFDRLDSGQFVVVLPTTNHAGATRCAERICAAITRYPIEGQYAVNLFGGVVEYRRGETIMMLLNRAEAALARAAAAGGERIVGYNASKERCADIIPLRN